MIDRDREIRRPGAQLNEDLVERLADYDEQVRAGADAPSTSSVVAAETPELGDLVDCVSFLERVWPRHRDAAPATTPTSLGRFRISRLLGHGGFGIVYLAVDPTLGRQVALKVPRLHSLAEPQLVDRFRREARATAVLDHPNIVPVYEAGEADGLCYIACAYCPGPTLAKWISEHARSGAPVRLAAEWIASLADAVSYSHAQGVLHRDIKPGNVLLAPADDQRDRLEGDSRTEACVPRLTDFGLAKIMEAAGPEGVSLTEAHFSVAMGTPAYMAPEQIKGSGLTHGPATDIYALGAVLYELLTGRAPFGGTNVADVVQQVQSSDPIAVRQLRQSVPKDLETICLTCLNKVPLRRYAAASDLRDDLRRFLNGEPVSARPPGAWDIASKWIRRNPALASLVLVFVLAAAGITAVQVSKALSLAQINRRLERSNDDLTVALQESQRLQQELLQRKQVLKQHAYVAGLDRAERDLRNGRSESAREILSDFLPYSQTDPDIRGIEWEHLWEQVRDVAPVREFTDERGVPLLCAALSPDGRLAATGDDSGRVAVWDAATGAVIRSWQAHEVRVRALRFSPDSRQLASGGSFDWLHVWDTTTWESTRSIQAHDGTIEAIDFSPDGEWIATGGRDGFVRIWKCQQGEKVGELKPLSEINDNVVYNVRFIADGSLVCTTREGGVSVVDTSTMQASERKLPHSNTSLLGADASIDGRLVAAGGYEGEFTLASISDQHTLRIPQLGMVAHSASVSGNGRRVCVTGWDTILTYDLSEDLRTCVRERRWSGHSGNVAASALSADGRWLLTAGEEGAAQLWDLEQSSRPITTRIWLPGHPAHRYDVALSSDGQRLALSGRDGNRGYIRVFDVQRQAWHTMLESRRASLTSLQFTADADRLFALVRHPTDRLRIASWNLALDSGAEFESVQAIADFALLKSDDSLLVASQEDGGHVGIWNRREQRMVRTVTRECGEIQKIELTPDERWLFITSADRPPVIVDVHSGRKTVVEEATGAPSMMAMHPGGRHLASMQDAKLCLFDADRREMLLSAQIKVDNDISQSVAISPDGRLMATITRGFSHPEQLGVTLWDLRSNRSLYTLPTYDQRPWTLSWSADGRTLAAGLLPTPVADGPDVILWHLGAGEPARVSTGAE